MHAARPSLSVQACKQAWHTHVCPYLSCKPTPSSLIEKFLVKNQKPNQIEYKLILSNYLCTTISNANTQNYKIIQLCRQLPWIVCLEFKKTNSVALLKECKCWQFLAATKLMQFASPSLCVAGARCASTTTLTSGKMQPTKQKTKKQQKNVCRPVSVQ